MPACIASATPAAPGAWQQQEQDGGRFGGLLSVHKMLLKWWQCLLVMCLLVCLAGNCTVLMCCMLLCLSVLMLWILCVNCPCSVWYELAYIESFQGVDRSGKVWQLAFGSGFKFNSSVMVAKRKGECRHGTCVCFSVQSE